MYLFIHTGMAAGLATGTEFVLSASVVLNPLKLNYKTIFVVFKLDH